MSTDNRRLSHLCLSRISPTMRPSATRTRATVRIFKLSFLLFLLSAEIGRVFSTELEPNYAQWSDESDRYDELLMVDIDDGLKSMQILRIPGASDFHPLLIEPDNQRIFVGARDAVFRLKSTNLTILERFDWPSSVADVEVCRMKGQSEDECHNFIRLLARKDEKLLICGTNAYFPSCTWRRSIELNFKFQDSFSGIGYAPYSPYYKSAYAMTSDGDLFTGVVTDFSGHDTSVLRMIPANKILRTAKSNSLWLNDPTFVAAFEMGEFVYYFFRETPVEASHCGNGQIYARIARVCKNDVGGDILLQDQWTTFSKARLNCSYSGADGATFSFDFLKSVTYVPKTGLIYAVFTTPSSHVAASAICAFDSRSITKSFSGSFAYQSTPDSFWRAEPNSDPEFNCQTKGVKSDRPNLTVRTLSEAQRYQLMAEAVQPISHQPLDQSVLERYSHIAVDVVPLSTGMDAHVLFVTTEDGLLKKFSVMPNKKACLVEVVRLIPTGQSLQINDIKLISEQGVVIIAANDRILKVNVQRCGRYTTKTQCVGTKDPYCGWNSYSQICTPVFTSRSSATWLQNVEGCDNKPLPVDGHFSEWSNWLVCPKASGNGETCRCRRRACNKPRPRFGGQLCTGPTVQVSNCTQNGGWTTWSEFSACTKTCGDAVRTRTRDCSNPSPAFGGLVCVGITKETQPCSLPECPEATVPPPRASWSDWSPWERCSKPCNGGFEKRTRFCYNSSPGIEQAINCTGSPVEFRACNVDRCNEARQWSLWTPWLQVQQDQGSVTVKRFRVACDAHVENPGLMSLQTVSQVKHCSHNGKDCTDNNFRSVDGSWGEWSAYSMCSSPCGNGTQYRSRTCTNPAPSGNGVSCQGPAQETRQCGASSCEATWTCWSDYSPCSVSCGVGQRQRVRHCQHVPGVTFCEGERSQTARCEENNCERGGFADWTSWSACNEYGLKVRMRACASPSKCRGVPEAQMMRCLAKTNALESLTRPEGGDRLTLILAIVFAFVGGGLLTLVCLCCLIRRSNSNCFAQTKSKAGVRPPKPPKSMPPAPEALKANIYTPPPSMRNVMPVANISMNPLNQFEDNNDYEGLSDQETSMTLQRNMRTSMKTKDYL